MISDSFFIDAVVFDDFLDVLFDEIVRDKADIQRVFLQYVSSYAFSNHEIVYRIEHMVSSSSIVLLVVPLKITKSYSKKIVKMKRSLKHNKNAFSNDLLDNKLLFNL